MQYIIDSITKNEMNKTILFDEKNIFELEQTFYT